jgi:hypothetical protein
MGEPQPEFPVDGGLARHVAAFERLDDVVDASDKLRDLAFGEVLLFGWRPELLFGLQPL